MMLLKADEEIGPRADRIRRVPQALRQTSEAPAARPTQFAAVAGHQSNQAYAPAPGFMPAQPHQASANSGPATVHMQSVAPASAPTPLVKQQWTNYQGVPMSCSQVQDPQIQDESIARIRDYRCTNCLDSVPDGVTHPQPCLKPIVCRQCLVPGHAERFCPQKGGPAEAAEQQQQQPARGWGGRGRVGGRGRGRGGFRPRNDPAPAVQPQPPSAEPVNQVSMMQQRFTGSQAVLSVHQQPDPRPATGRQPYRGHRQSRPSYQQPHRGQRPQYTQQRKNGTKPFPKLTRERVEIERLEGRVMQLAEVVKVMVGDMCRLTDYVGNQFSLRPIMGYPPLFGQVSQVEQGVQRQGGGGVVDGPRNPPVPHHNHYKTSGERVESYASNYAMHASDDNKDYPMFVNGERDRGRWGVKHDAPYAPNQVGHDAWHEHSDPYYDEPKSYEYYDEGEGYDYEYGYECQDDPAYIHDDAIVRRSSKPTSAPVQRVRHDPVVYRPGGTTREPVVEHPNHPPHPISRLGHECGEPAGHPVSRPRPGQYSGGPDDRSAERMPVLARAMEPLSAPLSGAGEETGAAPEDDLRNDLIPRQPDGEPAGDDNRPTNPHFNYYVQGYDRADGTQSAPPSIEGEGDKAEGHPAARTPPKDPFQAPESEEPAPEPESEIAGNDTTIFRDSGHMIAALTDALAPTHPSAGVNIKDSGQCGAPAIRKGEVQVAAADRREQGDAPPFMSDPSIQVTRTVDAEDGNPSKVEAYAGCLQNKYYLPPEAAYECAATLGMGVDDDCKLGSEENGEAAAAEDGEAAGEQPKADAYDNDECEFYDQGSGEVAEEGPANAAGAYAGYDDYDYDDDFDALSDGYESEIDGFDFSDSECGEETSPLNTSSHAGGNRTQDIAISGPAAGDHASRSGPRTEPPAADNQPSQSAPDPPRRQSPKRMGLTGGFISRVMFAMMLFGGVMMDTTAHLPAAQNNSLVLGWDCSRPDALQAYDRSSFCDLGRPSPRPGHPTATFELAQVVWVAEADAWDCRAVSTTTTHICGLWGYEKAVTSMTDRTLLKLTPTQCYQLSSRGIYKTEQGRVISGITAPGYTTAQFNVRGWDGVKNGDAACLGVKTVKKNTSEELARTVQSRFLEFTLKCVKLKMDRKSRAITVAGSGEKLACQVDQSSVTGNPKKAGCAGVGQTFVWDRADSSYCPLHFVKRIKGFLSGQTFVSPQHMVAFTVTQRRADAVTCPGLWQATNTEHIYVSADPGASRRLPRVADAELDPFLALLLTKRYLSATQLHLPDPARTDKKIKCLGRLSSFPGRARPLCSDRR